MPAQAVFVMRAFRSIDSSYFVWRAGEFDDDMSEANPPNPKNEYSDHMVIGQIGGPLARSDAEASPVAGLGTSGTPITFTTAGVSESNPGTDCQDFSSISVWVVVTAAPTTPAVVSLRSRWSNVGATSGPADSGFQTSDDAITSGASPQNQYVAEFTINGTTVAEGAALGPYNVPVRGRRHILTVDSDTNDVEGYVLAMRLA